MPEVGERYVGTVVKTTTFGAFVSLVPGRDGLLHISQIRRIVGGKRVENVEDVLNVGDRVEVEISELDPRGKISLHAVVERRERRAACCGRGADKTSSSPQPLRSAVHAVARVSAAAPTRTPRVLPTPSESRELSGYAELTTEGYCNLIV